MKFYIYFNCFLSFYKLIGPVVWKKWVEFYCSDCLMHVLLVSQFGIEKLSVLKSMSYKIFGGTFGHWTLWFLKLMVPNFQFSMEALENYGNSICIWSKHIATVRDNVLVILMCLKHCEVGGLWKSVIVKLYISADRSGRLSVCSKSCMIRS